MITVGELNLRHLRAIPLIAKAANMSAAADAANLSQPALTQGLAKLERQLGVLIFERQPRGMVVTPEGEILVTRIEAAFAHLAAETRIRSTARRGYGHPDHLLTATQMRSFLALADAGSFVEAARATDCSQPALHRAVSDLEAVCGTALVERRGRGVVLSAYGRKVARGMRLATAEITAAIVETRADARATGRLVVGAMPLSRARVMPAAIARFLNESPAATVNVVEGSWRELVEPLRDGQIDFLIGALRPEEPLGLAQEPLLRDAVTIIARAEHPLAAAPATLDALAAFPWIVGSPGAPLRSNWEMLFAGQRLPTASVECGSVMTIRGILRESDCLTLLSPDQVRIELEAGLLVEVRTTVPMAVRTIGITTRAHFRPTTLQARFLEILRETSATAGDQPG